MNGKVRVLSMTHPWASLVIYGEKAFETRSWPTSYRGPLVIQAAKTFPRWARELCYTHPFYAAMVRQELHEQTLPLGMALGTVILEECVRTEVIRETLSRDELEFGDYGDGRYAFEFTQPRRFKSPVPLMGMRKIFLAELAIEDDWYVSEDSQ